jgi:hypothetical protein
MFPMLPNILIPYVCQSKTSINWFPYVNFSESLELKASDIQYNPLLFTAYVNDIRRTTESTITLFADYCNLHRKIVNNKDTENLHIDQQAWGVGS